MNEATQFTAADVDALNDQLRGQSAEEIVRWAGQTLGPDIKFANSFGAEDVALMDIIAKAAPNIRVFTLDTGRLNDETYEVMDATRFKYAIPIEVMFPDRDKVEGLVRENLSVALAQAGYRVVEPGTAGALALDAHVVDMRPRARVELGHRAVDRHPGLRIAGQDGPLDRRRPSPPRQERRMDVEPEPALEQLGRDEEPVRDDHDRAGPDLDLPGEPLGLENGDAEPERGLLRRGQRGPAAAPARRVGPRQQRDDLMGGGEPLEHIRAERRRRGDGDASHGREANGGAGPAGGARAPRAATPRRCAG